MLNKKTHVFSSQIFRLFYITFYSVEGYVHCRRLCKTVEGTAHCRRLCKTTEIFVKKKHVFFYLIFIPTRLGFGL